MIVQGLAVAAVLLCASGAQAQGALSDRFVGLAFKRMDVNGNGSVSFAEVDAARARQFDRLDRNGDGAVSREEAKRIAARLRRGAARLEDGIVGAFDRFDRNGDGRVARQEFLARPPAWLRLFDTDDDGALTRAEVDRGLKILRVMRG